VKAVLPAKNILIGIAIVCALLFFANIVVRNIWLPAGALGLLVVSSVVIGGIYPRYTQQFRVNPNEIQREEPYIGRNIDATRTAYGIDDAEIVNYAASQDVSPDELRAQAAQLDTARLLDPARLSATFEQLQRLTFYFGVNNQLDIDRYEVDGEQQAYVLAAREVDINNLRGAQRSWINERLVYTHGNGLIAAPADRVDEEGVRCSWSRRRGRAVPARPEPHLLRRAVAQLLDRQHRASEIDGPLTSAAGTASRRGRGGEEARRRSATTATAASGSATSAASWRTR
jgi:uncharacterized membrane protein (UPF0182 family)